MPRLVKQFSVWFDYPGEDGARVEVAHLTDEIAVEIQAKAGRDRTYLGAEGQLVREVVTDGLLDRQLTCEAAVVGWENFRDEEGREMACDGPAKKRWACNREFWAFICARRAELAVLAREREQALQKN